MMKRSFTFVLAVLLPIFSTYAQTIKWLVEPKYADIDYYCRDIYLCADQNGKIQLLDENGRTLLPDNIGADAITDYNDGDEYAIVLQGTKILGYLSESKPYTFRPVSGDYHITEYPFFSEGFLVVSDSKGKYGYMDLKGQIAIDCKYEKARPFRQGRASVEPAKKQVLYINTEGKTNNPDSFHGGKLTKGSSFNGNGEAVVANYQDYAVINTRMQVVKKIKYTPELPVCQEDYSYYDGADVCDSRETGFMDAADEYTQEDNRCESFSERGAYGFRYKLGDEVVEIPEQFSKDFGFMNERAIVSMNGREGIIKLLKGRFEPNWPSENVRVYEDGASRAQFTLSVPASLQSDKIKLSFDKGDNRYTECDGLNVEFQAPNQIVDRKAKSCTLRAKATYTDNGPELLLWEGTQELGFDYISIGLSNPAVTSEYADENDNQTVKTTITNTSEVDVVVEATLKVDGQSVPFKGTLKPNQSKSLTKTLKVTESKTVSASVTVKVDGHDCGSKTSHVSLKI